MGKFNIRQLRKVRKGMAQNCLHAWHTFSRGCKGTRVSFFPSLSPRLTVDTGDEADIIERKSQQEEDAFIK